MWLPKGFRAQSKKQQQQEFEVQQRKAKEKHDKMACIVDDFLGVLAKDGFKVSDVGYFIKILQDKLNRSFNEKTVKEVLREKNGEKIKVHQR